jgi:hypothetical protein
MQKLNAAMLQTELGAKYLSVRKNAGNQHNPEFWRVAKKIQKIYTGLLHIKSKSEYRTFAHRIRILTHAY